MKSPVVSNAGPLLVLAKLNVLHLLKHLYGQIHIPDAVYEETVVTGFAEATRMHIFSSCFWIG